MHAVTSSDGPSPASFGAPAAALGGARVTGRIAEGTLAEVFRGEQEPLGRPVAVKVLKTSIDPSSALGARFSREGALLAKLAHQTIPQVFASGTHEGRPFFVLELVEGPTLAAVLAKVKPLPVDAALVIAHELANALACAHEAGLVHRDVKPSNVLLSYRGQVKLADFGIARVTAEGPDGLGVVGTPAYMSPEQVLGDTLDARSDLFSLGTVLYELLVGRRPFEEEAARTVMQKIRLDRYVSPRRVRREVPDALERILGRCLEKNPAHRYASAALLAGDLGELLSERGVSAPSSLLAGLLAREGLTPQDAIERARAAGEAWAAELGDEGAGPDTSAARERVKPARTGWLASVREAEGARIRGRGGERSAKPAGKPATGGEAARAATPLGATFWAVQGGVALVALVLMSTSDRGSAAAATAGGAASASSRALAQGEYGTVRVRARPWATVHLDGVAVDTTPMAFGLRVAPGVHYLRLTNPAFAAEERTVRVAPNATVEVNVTLGAAAPAPEASASAPNEGSARP